MKILQHVSESGDVRECNGNSIFSSWTINNTTYIRIVWCANNILLFFILDLLVLSNMKLIL